MRPVLSPEVDEIFKNFDSKYKGIIKLYLCHITLFINN